MHYCKNVQFKYILFFILLHFGKQVPILDPILRDSLFKENNSFYYERNLILTQLDQVSQLRSLHKKRDKANS